MARKGFLTGRRHGVPPIPVPAEKVGQTREFIEDFSNGGTTPTRYFNTSIPTTLTPEIGRA